MTILDTSNPANTVQWGYKIYGPWQWGVYGAFQNSLAPYPSIVEEVVAGTLRTLDYQQSSLRSIAIVMGIYGKDILTDGARGLAVVAQPWPIVRDYQKLLNLDTLMTDKLFDLGQAWGLQKPLTETARKSIINVLSLQQGSKSLFQEQTAAITIESKATPYHVIQLLLRINRRMKNMVTAGRNPTDLDISIKNDTIFTQINPWFWTGLQAEYACTRIANNACTQQRKDMTSRIASITTWFIDAGPKDARETIKRSLTRLKTKTQDLVWDDENISAANRADYEAREQELINAMWFKKHLSLDTGLNFSASLPRDFQDMKQTVKDRLNDITSYRYTLDANNNNSSKRGKTNADTLITQIYHMDSKGVQQSNEPWVIWSILSWLWWDKQSTPLSQRQLAILSSLQEAEAYHYTAMNEQAIASTDDSQLLLASLLGSIRYIKKNIYDPSDKETIYENIARICEAQCKNLWWICRF